MHTALRQRGSIIIYAMLTMATMLAIGLTMNAMFISKLRSAAAARNSVAALYAADSAIELCLMEARYAKNEPLPLTFTNTAQYSIANALGTDITGDCSSLGSSSFGFRAQGTYRGARRMLEISQ